MTCQHVNSVCNAMTVYTITLSHTMPVCIDVHKPDKPPTRIHDAHTHTHTYTHTVYALHTQHRLRCIPSDYIRYDAYAYIRTWLSACNMIQFAQHQDASCDLASLSSTLHRTASSSHI